MDRDDVRGRQPRSSPRFLHESLRHAAIDLERRQHHLERDLSAKAQIVCEKYGGHAAVTQHSQNIESADGCPSKSFSQTFDTAPSFRHSSHLQPGFANPKYVPGKGL